MHTGSARVVVKCNYNCNYSCNCDLSYNYHLGQVATHVHNYEN